MGAETTTAPTTEPGGPGAAPEGGADSSFWRATRLVAEREIRTFLRMKGFWVGLATLVIGLFAVAVVPSMLGDDGPDVAVVGSEQATALRATDANLVEVADRAAAERAVRGEEVDAAVVADTEGESATGVRVLALSEPPTEIVAALGSVPPVELLDAPEVSQGERMLVIMVFGVLYLVFGMGGMAIAQSTVTEKQTRVVEILVSTVPVRALLAGKIAGHALLTIAQVVLLAVAAPIALRLGGHAELLSVVAPALGWFAPFLCLGFVLLAALWAVAGAVVSRQEDLGSSMSLVMVFVMLPYFGTIFFADNATVLTVLSFVPFAAPVAMPVRLFSGDAQVWEAVTAFGLLACTVVAVVLLASRIYSGALLQTRGKVALSRAWARAD
ncbi:ABC transporter permease [Saccharomonospora saliphila]|uniref:ABC transporter permease n=1 Tax=Saccharomonospora saliphila TaxID=369829 RepID=UPI000370C925|nr:ABC transporter permease [Saccharomonospora saliphila]